MAKRLLLYINREYNRGPIIISSEYLYRPFKYKDTGYKHNKEPTTSSEYLWKPFNAKADHLCLEGK